MVAIQEFSHSQIIDHCTDIKTYAVQNDYYTTSHNVVYIALLKCNLNVQCYARVCTIIELIYDMVIRVVM